MKKKKYQPFISIEKRSSGEYAYRKYPYYDSVTKNTKYLKKEYLGKVTGQDENGDPIIIRVRGNKSRGKGNRDIDISAILKENSLFKRAVKDLSTQEKKELLQLFLFFMGQTTVSELSVSASKSIDLLEKIGQTKVEGLKPKPSANNVILQTDFRLQSDTTLKYYGLDFSDKVKTKEHTVLIKNTYFFPIIEGSLYPPYDSLTSLISHNSPPLEDNSIRLFDIQELNRKLTENLLNKGEKMVVLFNTSNMEQLKSVGIDIDKAKIEGSSVLMSFQDNWGSWRVQSTHDEKSWFIYNFRAKPSEIEKVVEAKRKVERVKNRISDHFKEILEEGEFIKSPKQVVESRLKLILYLGYVVEAHKKN